MVKVIIPIAVLLLVVLVKKIPLIGGKIHYAILIAGILSLVLTNSLAPAHWGEALLIGGGKLAWVIVLTVVGSIYAECQKRMGTMETVLNACRARFGRTPKGLVFVVMFVLCLSGSLLGESVASAVVIGALVIKNLEELGMNPEEVCATVVMGCSLGSIMPPVSQASAMAAGIAGLDGAGADSVINWTYITIGICFVLCCLYICKFFIRVKQIPEDLIPTQKASQILKSNWKTLVPLVFLALTVIFRSGFKIDILNLPFLKAIFDPISKIPVVSGFSYAITQLLYLTIIISLFYKPVRSQFGDICAKAVKHVVPTISVQICAAFMVGAFYVGGQIDATADFLSTLPVSYLIIGGCFAMCLMGMLVGSQTTTQTTVFTVLAPALMKSGVKPVSTAIAGGHWAMAGQGLPPADVVTFAVAGLVSSITGKEVDPVKSMMYSSFMCVCMVVCGLIFVIGNFA